MIKINKTINKYVRFFIYNSITLPSVKAMKMKIGLLGILLFVNTYIFSQLRLDTLGWIPPVDIPIYLSGNFAELRSDHFHSGIDIKTQGKEGFKIYAVQDGYISRIKVSSGGYGRAIYINHPDGYTSVYAHLKEYNIHLDKYVRDRQYQRKSFNIDIFPLKGELPVSQGDIIGLSGNTGSSAGPHLHFEIRDTKSEHPLNGLFLGYDIVDNIPPKMEYLYVYPQDLNSSVNGKNSDHFYSLRKVNGQYALRQGDTLRVSGNIGFGLKVNDYLNGSYNRCGVYELKAFIDDTLFFHDKFDGFSFAETRYINSLMDYKENIEKKRKLHKLFIEPNNKLSVYVEAKNRGIIQFDEIAGVQKIKIEAIDAYFNKTSIVFYAAYKKGRDVNIVDDYTNSVNWKQTYVLDTTGLNVVFSKGTFYNSFNFDFSIDTSLFPNICSKIYNLHNHNQPAHKYFNISIDYNQVADSLKQKLVLAKWNNDKFIPVGGRAKERSVTAAVRELGTYAVFIDTVCPTIELLDLIATTKDLSSVNKISFKIEDDFSWIDSYKGYINNQWVLFEYDAKNDLITYHFDEYMPNDGLVELKVIVADYNGNTAVYTGVFERYIEHDYDVGQ